MPVPGHYDRAAATRRADRLAKLAAKRLKNEARREAKRDQLRGAQIEELPRDYQGLARTLSYGD